MKNLAEERFTQEDVETINVLDRARRNAEVYFRKLSMAEHVYRKAVTDIYIAGSANKNINFEILADICDRYAGWLDDNSLVWWFIDGSEIMWNQEQGEPELITNTDEIWGKYLQEG